MFSKYEKSTVIQPKGDEDCTPERISHTEYWLYWNGNLDNPNYHMDYPNDSKDDWEADIESNIEVENDSGILKT